MWATFILLLLSGKVYSETLTRFTNIKCEVLDPSYCAYKQCELKVLGRGIIGLNVHAILLKGPFNNAKVNISLFRKFNGFRPFMFNTTYDFCKFMATKNKMEISFKRFMTNIFLENSNINHSCPYEKAIIVKDMILKEEHFKILPLPSGEYQVQIKPATDGHWKTRVSMNFLRKEDIMKN